jgi:hypothetical protein
MNVMDKNFSFKYQEPQSKECLLRLEERSQWEKKSLEYNLKVNSYNIRITYIRAPWPHLKFESLLT